MPFITSRQKDKKHWYEVPSLIVSCAVLLSSVQKQSWGKFQYRTFNKHSAKEPDSVGKRACKCRLLKRSSSSQRRGSWDRTHKWEPKSTESSFIWNDTAYCLCALSYPSACGRASPASRSGSLTEVEPVAEMAGCKWPLSIIFVAVYNAKGELDYQLNQALWRSG